MTRFDDQFPGSPEFEADAPRTTSINPFEIALWALAAVLIIGGIAAQAWSASRLGIGGPANEGFVLTQTTFSLAPAAITAGWFAVIVSLAFRAALLVVARRAASAASEARRTASSASTTPVETRTPAPLAETVAREDPLPFETPRFRQRQRAIDHSAFKRPGTE